MGREPRGGGSTGDCFTRVISFTPLETYAMPCDSNCFHIAPQSADIVDKELLLFSCSVMSDSLQPHGLQHARLPCPSLSLGVCSNSCPLSWWCHSTISSSVVPFTCPQSFPASRSFPVSQLFTSGGQIIGASASASVFSMNIQGWYPLELNWLVWSPCCPRDSQESSPTVWKHHFLDAHPCLWSNSHICIWLLEKP